METIHRDAAASLPKVADHKSRRWETLIALALALAVAIMLLALNPLVNDGASSPRVTPLPFGPGWAADYGETHKAAFDSTTHQPFGPGWAANYGVSSSFALPFGPEGAANYGVRTTTRLPFGPGLAATYGVPAR